MVRPIGGTCAATLVVVVVFAGSALAGVVLPLPCWCSPGRVFVSLCRSHSGWMLRRVAVKSKLPENEIEIFTTRARNAKHTMVLDGRQKKNAAGPWHWIDGFTLQTVGARRLSARECFSFAAINRA